MRHFERADRRVLGFPAVAVRRCLMTASGSSIRYFASTRKSVREGRRVGHGRPGGDDSRIVARHIRDRQSHDSRRRCGRRQTAALDRREVLAHRVDLADCGARAQQCPCHRLLVRQCQIPAPAAPTAPSRRPTPERPADRRGPRPCARSSMRAPLARRHRQAPDGSPREFRCGRKGARVRSASARALRAVPATSASKA